ncbi:hypothetical protein E1287_09045 [Actinomadura sp. KC06]|uniref:hypothetical protein n=1 Tax=Actinomadura sp. KC06 TaxID=2530369 RepID=UPI001049F1D9|nr:hypothetical protein [Actinomadura sp. KC06]TDD37293.1 hypothetical protein E1287_09045 [Actinomadura sp. KC06]
MHRTIGVTAAVVMAAGLIGTVPATASAAPARAAGPSGAVAAGASAQAGDVSTMSVHRKHRKCTKPKGKRFNISWADGFSSTTFYFNNHCKGKNYIRVWYQSNGRKCKNITVKPGVKGRKKLHRIYYQNLMHVDFGKCPLWP